MGCLKERTVFAGCNIKKNFLLFLLFIFIFFISDLYAGTYSGGGGSLEDPFQISTPDDLNDINNHHEDWNKHFVLINDINLAGYIYNMAVIAPDVGPGRAFDGTFDGNNYSIRNLVIDTEDANNNALGLFGLVNKAEIKNLALENVDITGGTDSSYIGLLFGFGIDSNVVNCNTNGNINICKGHIGMLTGLCSGVQIQGCSAKGIITSAEASWYIGGLAGECSSDSFIQDSQSNVNIFVNSASYAGGLAGYIHDVNVINSYSTGNILADRTVGGLVGRNLGSIIDCYAEGDVEVGTQSGGGLVGFNGANISFCFATGQVIGSGAEQIGGLVGKNGNGGQISNSYATGYVKGVSKVGGLVGTNRQKIIKCYSTGSMSYVSSGGGLLGVLEAGSVTNCFWDTETSGMLTSAAGTGKTTDEMQLESTFNSAGWDFITPIWQICPAPIDYPHLAWETISCTSYSGGLGIPSDPFLIATPDDIYNLRHNPGHGDIHFRVIRDISLAGYHDLSTIGDNMPFTGVFDGNDHTISDLIHYRPAEAYIGLFGYLSGTDSSVTNLNLNGITITGLASVGALIGKLKDGSVTNCSVQNSAVIGNSYTGGLIGFLDEGSVNNCYFVEGIVYGQDPSPSNIGGLVGHCDNGSVTNCWVESIVDGASDIDYGGGFIGQSFGSTIAGCFAIADVNAGEYVGGLLGYSSAGITNSYAIGTVRGEENVGGLVGSNSTGRGGPPKGSITNCYAAVDITGATNIGGLIGADNSGTYTGCFWDADLNPDVNGIGDIVDPAQVIGRTTSQMRTRSTFTGYDWDFVNETANGTEDIWTIKEGVKYPELVWPLVQYVDWDGVDFLDYSFFADYFGLTDCHLVNDCNWTDLDFSGSVDSNDVNIFTNYWIFSK
ncbi:MAG: GLUG motif-containing protein [Planctomycetota bacterium]